MAPPSWDEARVDSLLRLGRQDQSGRLALAQAVASGDTTTMFRTMRGDSARSIWLRRTVEEIGWPTRGAVGDSAATSAWFILQHSPFTDWQGEMLPTLEALAAAGELPPADLALFTDRVLVHRGEPQRYGNQFDVVDGGLVPAPIADLATLDARRAAVGLPPMTEYVRMLGEAYALPVMWPPQPEAVTGSCGAHGVAVQILGSGGPFVNADRASTSYLVWIAGRPRILVDAGGGAFLRFGQAGGRVEDLSLIAISHLHPDHVADLPALLWLSNLTRSESLPIVGPTGGDATPDFRVFLRRLFDEREGAFPLLGGTLRGSGFGVPLDVTVIDAAAATASTAFMKDGLTVSAIGVPHGNVPSLAYRIQTAGFSVVFGSDQTAADPRFAAFARDADVLIMHLMLGAGERHPLHAAPDAVGRAAHDAGARRLVLGHVGQFDLAAAIAEVRRWYPGAVTAGADLQCIPAT